MLYDFSLKIKLSCQTLSKAFEISKKTPRLSKGGIASKTLFQNNCKVYRRLGLGKIRKAKTLLAVKFEKIFKIQFDK